MNETLNKITSVMRKAIDDYNMIQDGDKICVGLSGGKDSLTLASALNHFKRFSPKKFDLVAITIDLFGGKTDYSKLKAYCDEIGLEMLIIPSNIYEVVFNIKKEQNPCSLCAKLRRGILNTEAKKLGCNKIALGHHADDLIETFMLSLFYEGRLSTFNPVSYLTQVNATCIRPFLYVEEKNIVAFAKDKPVIHNDCPADKHTQRQYVKDLINNIKKDIPSVKKIMHSALIHTERTNLIPPIKENLEKEMNRKNKKNGQFAIFS